MKAKDWFKNKLNSLKDNYEFRFESLILEITESINKRMIEKNINRSKLSELLNVSRPAVTKILNGNSNFTLKTLLSLSDALDLDLKVEFKERETKASEYRWVSETGYISSGTGIIKTEEIGELFTPTSSDWRHLGKKMTWDEAA